MNSSRRFAALFLLLLLGPLSGAAAPPAARAAVVERFAADPLAAQGTNPFFLEGDVPDHFVFLPDEPAHFPGDREGTLRVLYDTTVPAARIATPLGRVLSLDDDFGFGAVLTIRSEGYEASPDGFDQIAFGLWNSSTTGLDRTGFPSDSFDLVELDYFANVNPVFGGPFLSPTVFGGNVGGNAFFNFTFQSTEVRLPFDVPLLVRVEYGAAARRLGVTVSRLGRGLFFEAIPGAAVTVDLSTIRPTFLVDSIGIAAYFEGFPSLRAAVDYDLLYAGPLPRPFGVAGRKPRPARAEDAGARPAGAGRRIPGAGNRTAPASTIVNHDQEGGAR